MLAVLGCLLAQLALAGAMAGTAEAATTLDIDAGYAGAYVPGRPVPVRVRVTADRLLSAELQVSVEGPPTAVGIEVPGGTTKEFLVVVPTSPIVFASGSVTARASLPGVPGTSTASSSLVQTGDQEIVGLLPGALAGRALPGPAPLAVDVGTARFVGLGPLELGAAPDSLSVLGTIGIGGDELARQSAGVRTGLLHWVETGGRLLVDAEPGSPVAGLPDEWQPGSGGRARAGSGEIRLTGGAMAAGRWAGLVEPTSRALGNDLGKGVFGPPLGDLLANQAGFRVARISWLVGFLVLYVAVVGPVLFFVLRRWQRPELAWVAVPVVALLFTGGSWAAGRGLRTATPAVHGTVVVTGTHGSTALTYIGVSSRSGGTATLSYPKDWLTGARDIAATEASTTLVRATGSAVESRLPLDAGQFAVVSAQGPAAVEGRLSVTATAVDRDQVKGKVKNDTEIALDGVAIIVGGASASVGPLGPGQEREWTARSVANNLRRPADLAMWGVDGPTGGPSDPGWVRYSLWSAAVSAGLVAHGNGQAVAAGWTDDYAPPVKVNGSSVHGPGNALIVGTAPVVAGAGPLNELAVRTEQLQTSNRARSVVRLGLPVEQATRTTGLRVAVPTLPVEVWTGDSWTSLAVATTVAGPFANSIAPVGPIGAVATTVPCPAGVPCPISIPPPVAITNGVLGTELALPDGAVRDGAVYVRFPGGIPSSPFGEFVPVLREAA